MTSNLGLEKGVGGEKRARHSRERDQYEQWGQGEAVKSWEEHRHGWGQGDDMRGPSRQGRQCHAKGCGLYLFHRQQ